MAPAYRKLPAWGSCFCHCSVSQLACLLVAPAPGVVSDCPPRLPGPAFGGCQHPDPPLALLPRGDGETLGALCPGSSAPQCRMLRELQAGKEHGPPSPPWLPPPPRAHAVLGAMPRTSCSQARDSTARSCFLLKFCKSTSVRQVPGGCDGLLGKWGAGTSQGLGELAAWDHQAPGHLHARVSTAPPFLQVVAIGLLPALSCTRCQQET